MQVYPQQVFTRNGPVVEPGYTTPGMNITHLFMAHILTGLASNPATMLNIEEHLDYAAKMALAANSACQKYGL